MATTQQIVFKDIYQIVALAAIVGMTALAIMLRMGAGEGTKRAPKAIWLGRLAMCVTMAAALALAVTGIGAPIISDGRLGGWLLLGHVAVGGVFIAGLVGIALFYSDLHRFGCEAPGNAHRKLFFWLALILGVATTLTVMISMTPLFNSHGMDLLFQAHRWCALGVTMSLIGLGLGR